MVEQAVASAQAGATTGATKEEVESLVAGAVASVAAAQTPGLSASDVEQIVTSAIMAIPTATPPPVAQAVKLTADYWKPDTGFYGDPVYGGTLRINYEDPLDHANLWGAHSGVTVRYRMPTMNSLVAENPYQAGEIIPDLAKSWVQDNDLSGINFKFEDDIKWHNGADFVCEDARFSIETMATGNGISAAELGGTLSFIDVGESKCDADGSLSLRFNGPNSTALFAFVNRAFLIFNKDWFEVGGEDVMFNDVSVGTGPFVWALGQSVGNDRQIFEKNPNYFKDGLPYVDRVELFGILDENIQLATMLSRQTDWHWVRNFGQYDSYVNNDQIQTVIRATRGHHEVWLNERDAPFDNVKVRQAIMMGIDRDAGVKVLLDGHGGTGFIMPPGSAWELSDTQGCAVAGWCEPSGGYEAQRQEAITILEAENFPFDETFTFTVESDEQVVARATFIQEQLRLLGVNTDFDLVETVAYREQETTGTWGEIKPGNTTMPADDPFLGMAFYFGCASSRNFSTPGTPCDETSETLLAQLASTVDQAARKAISDELQLYLMGRYVKFPLYWEQEAVAFWPDVRGYYHHPQPSGAFVRWEQLWLDPSHKNDRGFSGQTGGVPGGIQ
jgi:ABC-type transport system substrate-binding protein